MKWKDLEKFQKRKVITWASFFIIVSVVFLTYACVYMLQEGNKIKNEYEQTLKVDSDALALKEKLSKNATMVTSGTYVETVKDISFKNTNFRVSFITWFKWEGNDKLDFLNNGFRVYNGVINKLEPIKNYSKDGVRYQEARVDVTVSKNFNISRFPLGGNILKFYIEPNEYTIDEVVFVPDVENSGVNKNLNIASYSLVRHNISENVVSYPNTMNNPRFQNPRVTSEIATVIELERSDWGLYLKCFIALIGTSIWVFMAFYVCANHKVNALGMVPATLFGSIANLMVGANLLPDVVELGLVEFVNIFTVMIIIGCIFGIINTNRIRETSDHLFEKYFGRFMFYTLLIIFLVGEVILPVAAIAWGN